MNKSIFYRPIQVLALCGGVLALLLWGAPGAALAGTVTIHGGPLNAAGDKKPGPSRDAKPIVLYVGEKLDNDFNELASSGQENFTRDAHIAVDDGAVERSELRAVSLKNAVDKGYDPIVAVGSLWEQPLAQVARTNPKAHFVLIDGLVVAPNVLSFTFRDNETGYLAGVAAALATKSGLVAFVGGTPLPQVRSYAAGFEQGVKDTRPDVKLTQTYLGASSETDPYFLPIKAEDVSDKLYKNNVDVIFAVAGMSSLGVLDMADQRQRLAIAWGTNHNADHAGRVLTSAVKTVDRALYRGLTEGCTRPWKGGSRSLGLSDQAQGLVSDIYNQASYTAPIRDAVDVAAAAIIAGKLNVAGAR